MDTGIIKSGINPHYYNTLSISALIAKSEVPPKQKQMAGNYMVIKKVFGFSAMPSKIKHSDIELLKRCNFNTLEYTTLAQMNEELTVLNRWGNSYDKMMRKLSDDVFEIRVKELKYLYASSYFPSSDEIYDGFKALEKYIEYIAE